MTTPLRKDMILRREENPHELLVAICRSCQLRRDDDRVTLHLAGWTLAVEPMIRNHEGFVLCRECSRHDYSYGDLY